MWTRGTNLFQSLQVSLLRSVRNTRDAGAEMRVEACVVNTAEPAGMSGVPSFFCSAMVVVQAHGVGQVLKGVPDG